MLLKSMNKALLIFLAAFLVNGCKEDTTSQVENIHNSYQKETQKMVKILDSLVQNGDPNLLYHWNSQLAKIWEPKINKGTNQQRVDAWVEFCKQTLYSGDSKTTIKELENYFKKLNKPYEELLNENTKILFDLLALAYLRLGEQENCQHKHTPFSCILPLQKEGTHELREGSEKAVELYTMIQNRFPNAKTKWLLNLASMTLGEYPKNLSSKHRINFPNWTLEQKEFPKFKEIGMSLGVNTNGLSGGVIVDDFNNDGFLDIFATSYGMQDQVKLFLNSEKGTFSDATKESGLTGIVSGLNCIQADYDNDGLKDILILRGGWLGEGGKQPNSLLKNLGGGKFADVTISSGIFSMHPTQTATWLDYNKDGFIDLFIGNESSTANSHPCELFENKGDGTFKEVSVQNGLARITGFVKGVTAGDINNDGWPDLYISVLGGKNLLYKNNNGFFIEMGGQAGVQQPIFSFPTWFWDVNNDGFEDIFVSSYDVRNHENVASEYVSELQSLRTQTEKPRLFINNGDETFTEQSKQFKLSKALYGMGANFGDLDNDGFLDFYIGTGAPDFSTVVPNRMFRNVNGTHFEEVTSAGNFGHIQKGHGVAFADIDNDGDQDIYAVMGGALEGDTFNNILYENPISKNNWIVIELEGSDTNKAAIGTKIELELSNGHKIYRTVTSGGTFGASSLQQEIGLGKATEIKRLIVYWQNTTPQTFTNISVNQKIKITEKTVNFKTINYNKVSFSKSSEKEHQH